MNLRMLITWAMQNNIDLDDQLSVGDHFNSKKAQGVMFNKTTNQVILMTDDKAEPRILEVITACQCPRAEALRYLQQSNWNVPLAIVTHRRETGR
jgi:hypothetical protein